MPLFNTNLGATGVAALLEGRRALHFIGVGGVQMSALCLFAHRRGFLVTGSDAVDSPVLARLRREGVAVTVGTDTAAVAACDAVVYSLAIDAAHPEYRAARALGVPVISRADFLAFVAAPSPMRIAVAGSHGKSSVTAMLAHVFTEAGRNPTVLCGAPLVGEDFALREGGGDVCIMEACEYRDSFLSLTPTLALLLSFDHDHTDYFPTVTALVDSFTRFAAKSETLIYNGEDATLARIARASHTPCLSFGVASGDAHAKNLDYVDGCAQFSLVLEGRDCGEITLRVAGRHNLQNALAAALAANAHGIGQSQICAALSTFSGLSRRMEYKGLFRGARVIDDYAHHPREIAAVLTAVRKSIGTGRLFAVFQPHTYSRTKAFLADFAEVLGGADRVMITDIYAAREQDTGEVSAAALADLTGAHADATGDLAATAAALAREVAAGDTVLVMGAGDTHRLFAALGL